MDAETLFPGPLRSLYDEFVAAVETEGEATEEFKKTQVSFGVERKFAWLVPLTKRKCLLVLDMHAAHESPLFRNVIRYGESKYTHQIEVTDPATVRQAHDEGWFALAYAWGAKIE